MNETSQSELMCHACSSSVSTSALFCSNCGKPLRHSTLSLRSYLLIAFATSFLFVIGWKLQGSLAGSAPTEKFVQRAGPAAPSLTESAFSNDLSALRKATEADPNSLEAWSALTSALLNSLQSSPEANPELLFEAIDSLKQIIRIDPENQQGLLSLAEISFTRQVFDKAADYYRRYLRLNATDNRARARLGSTLTFLNQSDDAEKELRLVLASEPQHFEANAYLAILLTQRGQHTEALEHGDIALALAPNEEARTRLSQFLSNSRGGGTATPTEKVENYLRQHAIAGARFVKLEVSGDILRIFFKEFPMNAMPGPVREKFIKEIQLLAGDDLRLEFVDAPSGQPLL